MDKTFLCCAILRNERGKRIFFSFICSSEMSTIKLFHCSYFRISKKLRSYCRSLNVSSKETRECKVYELLVFLRLTITVKKRSAIISTQKYFHNYRNFPLSHYQYYFKFIFSALIKSSSFNIYGMQKTARNATTELND